MLLIIQYAIYIDKKLLKLIVLLYNKNMGTKEYKYTVKEFWIVLKLSFDCIYWIIIIIIIHLIMLYLFLYDVSIYIQYIFIILIEKKIEFRFNKIGTTSR